MELLEYLFVRGLSLVVNALPWKFACYVASFLGNLGYLIDKRHRLVALRNLRESFGSEKSESEIKRIARGAFQNLVKIAVIVLRFPKLNKHNIDQIVTIEGKENLDQALSKGKGVVFLSGHIGNWELTVAALPLKGYFLSAIAQELRNRRVNDLVMRYRERIGTKLLFKSPTLKDDILGSLKDNRILGIASDQDAGPRGVFLNFFGRPASTHPGAIAFALSSGAVVLPHFMVREKGNKYKLIIEGPLELSITGDKRRDIAMGLKRFNKILESYIRRYPDQYLWLHRRWKTRPQNIEH